ncbi:MAG TPA: T9SS type A sorting domain-containing protein, partial [Ignavibacteria bacterium]|nr:T9SS type A sorting domain-containing protein [Ignavibacteria bacterium]
PINEAQYKVTINLTQDININPSFFTMPIQINIITQAGDSLVTVFNNMQSQNFEFIFNSKPLNFKIDPNNHILKDIRGEDIIPVRYALSQNYPNPFNPVTNINYELGKPSNVIITIFDILGQTVGIYKMNNQREGNYTVPVNLNGYASGAYFYLFEAWDLNNIDVNFSEAKEMMYIK